MTIFSLRINPTYQTHVEKVKRVRKKTKRRRGEKERTSCRRR
jgi:hypothetical protein